MVCLIMDVWWCALLLLLLLSALICITVVGGFVKVLVLVGMRNARLSTRSVTCSQAKTIESVILYLVRIQ
jgi:hypothetical protein